MFASAEVLWVFLKLGLRCFGGPVAHIGYFREEFVARRGWLREQAFADLVGLCQFLPGPASSQVGFSIGVLRAGYLGGLAAWTGFTLPSAAALVMFAYASDALRGPLGHGLLHGLKLVAVPIVAQAVWSMARNLCPDRQRAAIAAACAVIMLLSPSPAFQIVAIVAGAMAGLIWCRTAQDGNVTALQLPVSRGAGLVSLALCLGLLLVLPLLHALGMSPGIALFEACYRSGALVFGGGHVVLPLLRQAFVPPGWLTDDAFLAGYGAAQAMPGPLFAFAAYLGAVASPLPGLRGAAVGLLGIFLPGILILLGTLPFWDRLRRRRQTRSVMNGVNAAVVGVLGAALYDPVMTTSVTNLPDVGIALAGFLLLMTRRASALGVVVFTAIYSVLLVRAGA